MSDAKEAAERTLKWADGKGTFTTDDAVAVARAYLSLLSALQAIVDRQRLSTSAASIKSG